MNARSLLALGMLALASLAPAARAHESHAAGDMAHAAIHFLNALTPEQRAKAQFTFADEERKNWHFVPRARKGLSIKEMTQAQRLLAHGLLATGLSPKGYVKATGIMSLEEVLAELEKSRTGGPARDAELYFVSIFGEPGKKEPWGWRFEGHHLALNFTAGDDHVFSVTPSFFGTNPGEIREGPRKGTRYLGDEEDLARALVKSLDEEQRKAAVILAEAPKEIFNLPGRADGTKPEGIAQAKLNAGQRDALAQLIRVYLDRHRPEVAQEDWAKIEKAGIEKVQFAWAGGLERGEPHYYRVQGPSFVLEYDNTQNGANHVHSVWRSFENDFGADLLRQHYQQAHGAN